jgi:diadenosine tetraphosphate (Ap4A) HIT family hydrolase
VQPTLGSLVLVCKDEAAHFGEISEAASTELRHAVAEIERALGEAFHFEKINYLMLMMVDPDVHFHVIPRYSGQREFAGSAFPDAGWPGPPQLEPAVVLDVPLRDALRARLIELWS